VRVESFAINRQGYLLVEMRRQAFNEGFEAHHHRFIVIIEGLADLSVEATLDVVCVLQSVKK